MAKISSKRCLFCTQQLEIDYKNAELLRKFVSPFGRILPRTKTGTCAKHQRQIAQACKRARHLALLPFVVK